MKAVPNTAHLAISPAPTPTLEVKEEVIIKPNDTGDAAALLAVIDETLPLVPETTVEEAPVAATVADPESLAPAPAPEGGFVAGSLSAPALLHAGEYVVAAKPSILKRPCDFIINGGKGDQITARHITTGYVFEGTTAEFNKYLRS